MAHIAVIDVGSNSVRLLVARPLTGSAFEVVDEERFDARLGEGQADGRLTDAGIERGLKALRIMASVAQAYSPERTVVVGTEALRRATNGHMFTRAAFEATGLEVRILSGKEEAHAGYLGVINSTALRDGHLLDIGGGSLELMRVEGRELLTVKSAPLGAIYASEHYLRSDPPSNRELRALRRAVRQQFTIDSPMPELYASGGAVRNLARMVRARRRYPLRRLHGFVVQRAELRRLARTLSTASLEERRKLPGISPNRLDTLPAAAVVIDEVMELTRAATLTVSGQGLREGILWGLMRGHETLLPDVRTASIDGLAAANGVDPAEGDSIVAPARLLFEATAPLHGLNRADLDLLTAAARLGHMGMHVEFYNRDRHAEYLVHSGDLHGFTHREVVLLAAVLRWASSGTPDLAPYGTVVQPDDARRAAVLSALLGMARAIARRHPSPVRELNARLDNGLLFLELRSDDEALPELHELARQQKRFEAVLKVSPAVSVMP